MAEDILHFGAIKFRLNGNGNMQMQMQSLDNAKTSDLLQLGMSNSPGIEPTRRCNFVSQRAKLKVYTTQLDEHVKINRIIFYVKSKASSYPM